MVLYQRRILSSVKACDLAGVTRWEWEAYRKKSESYLISAKILFENGRLEETVSMAY